jgi:uncharacterized protein (DUF2141 family)
MKLLPNIFRVSQCGKQENFLGLPGESYGFSNDLHPMFSVPVFNEAEFKLNQPVLVQNIELNN